MNFDKGCTVTIRHFSASGLRHAVVGMGQALCAILITIAACSRDGDYDAPLAKVDSLMDARPDSALYILDTLEASSHGFPKSTLRRWQLLRLMAQNKCDTIFRSDSLHLVLTDYFDRNGTPNERMTAYYLLGRAYVDMGDAPLALKCYLKATECADTTSDQCDWRQLTIIHMQTGLLFYKQYMPNEALESFAEAIWSAVSPTVNYRYFT